MKLIRIAMLAGTLVAVTSVLAQPVDTLSTPPGTPGIPHAAAHHHPGAGIFSPQMLAALQSKLNLNSSQQQQWSAATALSQQTRLSIRTNMQKLKQATDATLTQTEPDLATLAATADQTHQANRELRLKAQSEWLKLYAMLSSEQKIIVRDALRERLAKFESFRSRMRERVTH